MSIIELDLSNRTVAAISLMSHMLYPDDAELRLANEINLRTITAHWCSARFAQENRRVQRRLIRRIYSETGKDLRRELADSVTSMKRRFFDYLLEPVGGTCDAAFQLTMSPSMEELDRESTNRWWSTVYTGKLILLVGRIHEHHPQTEASLNKAIHILCVTEGKDENLKLALRQRGLPGVYESSLKQAWSKFTPVAHLCAAYVITQTLYREEFGGEFWEWWEEPPVFRDALPFKVFCAIAKCVETFATLFLSRGRQPLISREKIFALPEEIDDWLPPQNLFWMLSEDEIAALNTYRAPKYCV